MRSNKTITRLLACMMLCWGIACTANESHGTAPPWPESPNPNNILSQYFASQVSTLTRQSDVRRFRSRQDWESARPQLRDELADMLGLLPEPERSDLLVTTVGTIERDDIIVDRLHYQPFPGLYVAANLYRPANISEPLPAILYVCGHSSQVETNADGQKLSYGNKTGYQRHGAWFARHGYVCLTIDTVQWGEFLGSHWGTYRDGRWDWVSKGYTPAGVEAWSGIRALDYLASRPDVDSERLGLTGRSGGGAYSWFIAALDSRVKAVVPVAGITDLENHVIDGCVTGHCDCMYFVNYYGWDYPQLAALISPRPLLIANSDNDTIFPLDGVLRTAQQVQHIYDLYEKHDSLGLLITPGPHEDTPELQVGAFRWFDRHLQGKNGTIDEPALPRFTREELKVFAELPSDQRVTTIEDHFVERLQSEEFTHSTSASPIVGNNNGIARNVLRRSLHGWPQAREPLDAKVIWERVEDAGTWQVLEYCSQVPWRLQAIYFKAHRAAGKMTLRVVDSQGWNTMQSLAMGQAVNAGPLTQSMLYVAARGVGPHAWLGTDTELNHQLRRFYLIGQTLPAMQAYDVERALELANQLTNHSKDAEICLEADNDMSGVASLIAALHAGTIKSNDLRLPDDPAVSMPLLGFGRLKGAKEWLQSSSSRVDESK